MPCKEPGELVRNTWYIVFFKGTKKVAGEIIFTSYNLSQDSIRVNHVIPFQLQKICIGDTLPNASQYEYCRAEELHYPHGHIHAKSPFYLKSWDAIFHR
jgi:hypothetical protein